MRAVNFSHGGNIYEHKKRIVDFSANINPLGLPRDIKEIIYKNFDRILHYPDPDAKGLTKKIAKYWGINDENILLGNGSLELIYLIMSAYRPKTTLIPAPTFSEYERAAKAVNSKIKYLKLREKEDFRLNLSSVDKADMFFLCNPNNPTGNLVLPSLQGAGKASVVDEAFMDFLPDEKDYTFIWKAIKSKKLIVLRTFTKFFALPGLRIGYLVAHKKIITKLKQHQPPWSTNALAQLAAELILKDKAYLKKTHKLIAKERKFLFEQLTGIKGLKPYPSVTNFLLVKIALPGWTSTALKEALLKKGILVRDCVNFRNLNDKYIRVAVRSHKENLQLLKAVREIL